MNTKIFGAKIKFALKVTKLWDNGLFNPEVVSFIFAGRNLENEKTIADYNIRAGDTIFAVMKLTGS